jgi:hypothetical protein
MATYTMLGMYTYEKISSDDFKICFEIPDNCNYVLNQASGKYTIEIHLNGGEKSPSTNFDQHSESVSLINGELDLTFEQYPHNSPMINKPKAILTDS